LKEKRRKTMPAIPLTTPLTETAVRALKVGDAVEITGRLYTGRDAVHHRLHTGAKPPVNLAGAVIYHCGPVMVNKDGGWSCAAAGPTTSMREEPYQWEVMRDHGIRGVIGKGGMGPKTLEGCKAYGCVYLHAIGGAAQVYAERVVRVDGVDWLDLGSPEAMWRLWVERFPVIVTMDAHGESLHQRVFAASAKALAALRA
jgi:fumarate hydratase class I